MRGDTANIRTLSARYLEADDQIDLRLRVVLVLRRQLAVDVETLLVGGERARLIAPRSFTSASFVRLTATSPLRVALVLRRKLAENVEALRSRRCCIQEVASCNVGGDKIVEHCGAAAQQLSLARAYRNFCV
jgi:hypothetical protein